VGSASSSYCSSLMSLIQAVFIVVLFNDFLKLEIRNVNFANVLLYLGLQSNDLYLIRLALVQFSFLDHSAFKI
jgi:hypothetical protein